MSKKVFRHKGTGELVKTHEHSGGEYYIDVNFDLTPKRFIEDSSEWEEIEEKEYEVITYRHVSFKTLYHLQDDGGYKTEGCNITFFTSDFGDKNPIISVKRLSDGEIFTVGDKVKHSSTAQEGEVLSIHLESERNKIYLSTTYCESKVGTLLKNAIKVKEPLYTTYDGVERFDLGVEEHWVCEDRYLYTLKVNKSHLEFLLRDENTPYKIFSTEEAAKKYIASVTPLFTTEDGVEIFDGDYYCRVGRVGSSSPFECWDGDRGNRVTSNYSFKLMNEHHYHFSSQKAAEEWILMNKPLLSLNDLLSVWKADADFDVVKNSKLFKRFLELAKTK